MPPKEKLSAETLANFRAWVEMGAPDPRVSLAAAAPSHLDIEAAKRTWWSFPQAATATTARGEEYRLGQDADPINLFSAKLEAKKLTPSRPADEAHCAHPPRLERISISPGPAADARRG